MILSDFFDMKVQDESFHHPILLEKQIELNIRRLDRLHLHAGGNKIFKLQNWLHEIEKYESIISFGGAFSNHLLALSAVAKMLKVKSIGIIRGEKPAVLNHYLTAFVENGMELIFVSRTKYKNKTEQEFNDELHSNFPKSLVIPEGGAGENGISGAMKMVNEIEPYDLIVLPCATGTTLAGIALKNKNCKIIGFQVLKGEGGIQNELMKSAKLDVLSLPNLIINDSYHFGGYAKVSNELINFQKDIFLKTKIPLDKVYGIKAMYGLLEEIKAGKIKVNSKILYIHTGGTFDFINQ